MQEIYLAKRNLMQEIYMYRMYMRMIIRKEKGACEQSCQNIKHVYHDSDYN